MYSQIDKRYDLIRQLIIKNNGDVNFVDKAYNMAKTLHNDQLRKDGTPYLGHPVEVALILANLGFDENVITGALLHDVVEDCGCTLETISNEFNSTVANLVDCVSAIDNAKFQYDEDDLYEDKNFEKASIEEQSFRKLVNIGQKNPLGFCIKFADRLHNLSTIDIFPYSKQLEKIKETEKWIIPIAKILNAEYFYRELKNYCFKVVHKYDGYEFFKQYNTYHKQMKDNVESLLRDLESKFANTTIKNIDIKDIREYKVYEDLNKLLKNLNISTVSQGQILKVANYNIYLLYDKSEYKDIINQVWEIFSSKLENINIIDAKIGSFTKQPYFQLEDKYKNKFNLYVMSLGEFTTKQLGTLDGQMNDVLDVENFDNLGTEMIKIKTRSGDIKYMPKGSTALDFAFKIHKDIGLGFKYAIINGSKTKSPTFTKLFDGDEVNIVVEKDNNGVIEYNAELKWFAHVNTDFSKKVLIKYFEKKL